jgi:hypothetical protein
VKGNLQKMGSLLSVNDMAMENDWDGDRWDNSRRGGSSWSRNGSPRSHMHRKPNRRNFNYQENVRLNMGDHVYLSGPNRKVNPRSRRSSDTSETVTFTTYTRDSHSEKYVLSESKMSIWTDFIFVEFAQRMGADAMGKPILAVRLKLDSNQSMEYLVSWSSFTQNFTPFDKESSTRPDNMDPEDEQWMGYLFSDDVWKNNETHHEALTQAQKALARSGGSNGGGWR